jgi:uncharacterized membrane protein
MNVYFKNNYTHDVWIAYTAYDPDNCAKYGNWSTHGWWKLCPGEQECVFETNNIYAYFYAEASDGTFWGGDDLAVDVSQNAFDSCIDIGTTQDWTVGMRQIVICGDTTENLNP